MAKTGVGGAQDAFAQDAAMGMHESERGVVADRADIAEVIGQSFELRHQCAQIMRAGRHGDVQRCFHGVGEGERIGNRAVARGAACQCAAFSMVAPAISESMPLWT